MPDGANKYKIESAEAYRLAVQTLNKKDSPPKILQLIMNGFESYRASRKLGWSRPWNKYGVRTFRSYKLDFEHDMALIALARDVLEEAASGMPDDARAFVEDLLDEGSEARGKLMGFIFFHEFEDGESVYEGVTLSFGRMNDKRFRDRFDLVFEAPLDEGHVGSFERLRIYVDPFQGVGELLWETECSAEGLAAASLATERLCAIYREWELVEGRIWDHWTSAYVNYFGPRQHYAKNSHFPISKNEAERLLPLVGVDGLN